MEQDRKPVPCFLPRSPFEDPNFGHDFLGFFSNLRCASSKYKRARIGLKLLPCGRPPTCSKTLSPTENLQSWASHASAFRTSANSTLRNLVLSKNYFLWILSAPLCSLHSSTACPICSAFRIAVSAASKERDLLQAVKKLAASNLALLQHGFGSPHA